ncbi:GntR family transcriptional regulator [Escherichia coli]|nr:GntR family transcriptional regulator [Escherichia coli]
MEITEPRRLYQQLAADLKERIEQGVYLVVINCLQNALLPMKRISRTVVREAIIMLEVEGYVEVRKGSGIHVFPTSRAISRRLTIIWNSPITVRLSCFRLASSSKVILPSSRQLR